VIVGVGVCLAGILGDPEGLGEGKGVVYPSQQWRARPPAQKKREFFA